MSSSADAEARRRGRGADLNRLADDRYCAPCGILFWRVQDAAEHRREQHPEQARYERTETATLNQ